MKKLLLIILSVCVFSTSAVAVHDNKDQKIELTTTNKMGRDKSLSITFVEAWIDNINDKISVVGSGLKDTYIFIFDASGNAVEVSTVYFGDIKEEHLFSSPASPGRYWLVIDSPEVYAEGTFLVQ